MQMRRPKPRKTITSLRELVLELDERLEGGDELSDVWLPGGDWADMVGRARLEGDPRSAATVEADDGENLVSLRAEVSRLRAEIELTRKGAQHQRSLRELERQALAKALDVGGDTEWDDLLEVASGYVQALDAERAEAKRAADEREELRSPAKKKPRAKKAFCGTCNARTPHNGDDECTTCTPAAPESDARPAVTRPAEDREGAFYVRRGDEWLMSAGATKSQDGWCNDKVAATFFASRSTAENWAFRYEDAEIVEVPLAEAMAKPRRAPGRATKKFPKGGTDLAEKCAKCGAELGEHAGTKCPPKQRRMPIHDVPAEGAPF